MIGIAQRPLGAASAGRRVRRAFRLLGVPRAVFQPAACHLRTVRWSRTVPRPQGAPSAGRTVCRTYRQLGVLSVGHVPPSEVSGVRTPGTPCRQSRDHVSQPSPSAQARARTKPSHRSHQRLPSRSLLEFFSSRAHAIPFARVPALARAPSGPDPGADAPGRQPCRSQSALLGARSPKGHNCGPSRRRPPPVRGRWFAPGDENARTYIHTYIDTGAPSIYSTR